MEEVAAKGLRIEMLEGNVSFIDELVGHRRAGEPGTLPRRAGVPAYILTFFLFAHISRWHITRSFCRRDGMPWTLCRGAGVPGILYRRT